MKSLKEMEDEVIAVNTEKGWIGNGVVEPTFGEAMMLINSEVSEAFEAWREIGLTERTRENGKPDDVASEFADVFIRLLHYCRLFGIDLQAEYERKIAFNRTRPYRHGGKNL